MILKVFAVRDTKACAFLQPFFSNSVGSALRAFGDAVNEKGSPFNKHPEDYLIYHIGSYDDSLGALVPEPDSVLHLLGAASDFVGVNEPAAQKVHVPYSGPSSEQLRAIGADLPNELVNGKE